MGLLVVFSHSGQALAESEQSNWEWGGFVSQSAVYTSDNSFFSAKTDDHISGEFSETGIIGTGRILNRFDIATQIMSRRAGDISDGNPQIDYLQLTYRFYETMQSTHSVRLGRFKTPLGFYNDTRDVPFTRSGIFLPQGMYWERVRNIRSFINGGQYSLDHRVGLNEFNLRLSYGDLQMDQDEFDAQAGTNGAGTAKVRGLSNIAWIHDYDGGRIRWGLSRMATRMNFIPDSTSLIDSNGNINAFTNEAPIRYELNILSAEYNAEEWSFTLEYMRGKTEIGQFSNFFPEFDDTPVACYGQITYRPTDELEFFVRYEGIENNYKDPRGKEFAQSLRDVLANFNLSEDEFPLSPDYSRYAFDKTLGMGWKPMPGLLLRAEWHHVIGTSWIANYGLNSERLDKEWDLVAIQLSYRFK